MKITLPDRLVAAVSQRTLLPFVGHSLDTLGNAPGWRDLLLGILHDGERQAPERRRELAEAVASLQAGDLASAASAAREALGERLPRLLMRQMSHESPVLLDLAELDLALKGVGGGSLLTRRHQMAPRWPHPVRAHRLLVWMTGRLLVSTGYGTALDRVAADPRLAMPVVTAAGGRAGVWLGRRPVLMKLHGDMEFHADLCMSQAEHNRAAAVQASTPALIAAVQGSVPLLVGYEEGDADLDWVLSGALSAWRLEGAYVALAEPSTELTRRIEVLGHRVLRLKAPEEVGVLLQRLAEQGGQRLGITVMCDEACETVAAATSFGMHMCNRLNRAEGPVRFTAARPGQRVEVDVELGADVMGRLMGRLRRDDPLLRGLLGESRALLLDGIALEWRARPDRGPFI